MCSGTDSPLLAWDALSRSFLEECGVQLEIDHVFSAESCLDKRAFIRTLFPGTIVFDDVLPLHSGRGTVEGVDTTVTGGFRHLIAGFPCKTASSLNRAFASARNRTCIANRTDVTGQVFWQVFELARKHLDTLEFIVLENVLQLAIPGGDDDESNLDVVVDALESIGFVTVVWHLTPEDWGVPVSRFHGGRWGDRMGPAPSPTVRKGADTETLRPEQGP